MLSWPLMENNIIKEDIDALIQFLQSNNILTQSENVKEFEKQWSDWLGVKHSVFVNSGSSANFITMAVLAKLYGTGEVIVPALTWSSDISSVMLAGHTPVFVDIEKNNLAMSVSNILDKITVNTKAVFFSHILGFNGLSELLLEELDKRNILLIEDVCESHGATFHKKKCGSYGYASNFSYYFAHHMSTIEGGMICTNDETFYEYARMYRSHGLLRECTSDQIKDEYYKKYPDLNPEFTFTVPGFNMRSTELNAVIGLNQLKRLDANNIRRTQNFDRFLDKLDAKRYYVDFDIEGSVNYAFVVMLRNADLELFQKIYGRLQDEKIEFRRGTAGGGNQMRQPFVRERFPESSPLDYTNADFIHFYGLYIGNYPTLENEKIDWLIKILNTI